MRRSPDMRSILDTTAREVGPGAQRLTGDRPPRARNRAGEASVHRRTAAGRGRQGRAMTTAAPARPRRSTSISARLTLTCCRWSCSRCWSWAAPPTCAPSSWCGSRPTRSSPRPSAPKQACSSPGSRFREDQATLRDRNRPAMREAAATLVQEPTATDGPGGRRNESPRSLTARACETVFSDAMVVRAADKRVLGPPTRQAGGGVLEPAGQNGALPATGWRPPRCSTIPRWRRVISPS